MKFECCQCHELHTEEKPFMWGYFHPYTEGDPACKNCVDTYNGPGDEYYENQQQYC